jgi:protein TonB
MPDQVIDVPAAALAAAAITLPGMIESPSFSAASLGSGTRLGAGTGDNGGIGPGDGPGVGPGVDGGIGGGPNRGTNLVLPIVLRDVKPQYTTEAMRARVQGAVVVRAIVHTDGTVRDVRVIRSLDPVFGLDQAAVRAASQWLFRPGLMEGEAVPVAVTIELLFTLR